jgi:hypothetical protein
MKFGIWTSFAEKCITRLAETHAAKPAYFFFAAFNFAQRALCAAAILFLPAADIVRRGAFTCDCLFTAFVPSSRCSTRSRKSST